MSGNLFKRYRKIIRFLVSINSFFPTTINLFLLELGRNIPLKLGVLIRYVLLKNLCKEFGENVIVFKGVIFDAPEMMQIGNNVSINPNCYLAGEINIGNDVSIAHNCAFHSYNHTWGDKSMPIRNNPLYSKRIFINDNVWIGCSCVILSGVVIGSRSVIGAGSIVNKAVDGNTVVGGNPARLLKRI